MTKKDIAELTELQLRILGVLWEHGASTATQVHEHLERSTGLSRKTVGTLLYRLEQQRILGHSASGREYVYHARVTREQVQRQMVKSVVGQLFPRELPAMLSYALEAGELNKGDLDRLRAMIDELDE